MVRINALLLAAVATGSSSAVNQTDPLPLLGTFAAKMEPLDDSGVSGTIMVAVTHPDPGEDRNENWVLFYGGFLTGLEPNVNAATDCGARKCNIALHYGTCDKIKGRVYTCGSMRDADQDPYSAARYSTNEEGEGSIQSFFIVPNYGITYEGGVWEHVLVVRGSENGADKVACGAVQPLSFFANDPNPIVSTEVSAAEFESNNDQTNTSVVVFDMLTTKEKAGSSSTEPQQRCYVGYAEGPTDLVEDFLTTATQNSCTANNSHVRSSWDSNGVRTGNVKTWFGGCSQAPNTGDDEEEEDIAVAAAKAATTTTTQEKSIEDFADMELSCGFYELYYPPTRAPTPKPTSEEESAAELDSSYEELEASKGNVTSSGSVAGCSVLTVLTAAIFNFWIL